MADIFPEEDALSEAELVDATVDEAALGDDIQPPEPYGFTWKFDFETGDIFTGEDGNMVVVEDHATLRDWLGHCLSTQRHESPIFGTEFGTDINLFIGARTTIDSLTMGDIETEVMEAVMQHDRVTDVQRVAVIPLDHDVFVYMRYTTDDAMTIEEVATF